MKNLNTKTINKLLKLSLFLVIIELLFGSCGIYKTGLRDSERNLLRDVEKFNRDYGSKGVTLKNRKIEWIERFVCNGLILKNSLIKNVELQKVDLKNTYIENSRIENVYIREMSDLSGSTFKNVRFKNLKIEGSDLSDSIFIDCEFINCEYIYAYLGKEYRNCKFNKIKEEEVTYRDIVVTDSIFTNCKIITAKYSNGKFENVIFKNSEVRGAFGLRGKEGSKNIQFLNCITGFGMFGNIEDILIQNSKPVNDADLSFEGDMKNIIIRDFPKAVYGFYFGKGTFSNISIINCKYPCTKFYKVNLSNLLIKDSGVQHLKFEESDVSGDNKIDNSEIWGIFFGDSKVKDLKIENCEFEDYVQIVFSELIRLRLSNNTYKGDVEYAIKGEMYIDSDKFLLKSTPFPEDSRYLLKRKERK